MAEPLRSDEYGARPNTGQVERARRERQAANDDWRPADQTRNTNVVRLGDTRDAGRATPARREYTSPYNIPNSPDQQRIKDTARVFRESYDEAGMQPQGIGNVNAAPRSGAAADATRSAAVEYAEPEVVERPTNIPVVRRKEKEKPNAVRRELARLRATGVNLWAIGISGLFFVVVLILSVVSIVFLGLAYFVEWIISGENIEATQSVEGEATFFQSAFEGASGLISSVGATAREALVNLAEALTGVSAEAPLQIFASTYLISVAIGWSILMLMFVMYTTFFVKSVSGTNAHVKQIGLLIAIIGHAIPGMNLLPWFLFWGISVWLYPK